MKIMLLLAVSVICCAVNGGRMAYLTVKVVDSDTDMPIKGIHVHGGFRNHSLGWHGGSKDNSDESQTDGRGMCRLSGFTDVGHSCCIARNNEHFYDSEWYSFDYAECSMLKFWRWMPDDIVVTMRLDRVMNPIPLYVKDCAGIFRHKRPGEYAFIMGNDGPSGYLKTNDVTKIENVRMSYDFLKHDWLPPFGKGEMSDIQFVFNEDILGWEKRRGYYTDEILTKMYRFSMVATLPGEGNGIQEITNTKGKGLKIRKAAESGYLSSIERWKGFFGGVNGYRTDFAENRCYTFRIRTEYDDQGKIKSAYYGKIYGDFDLRNVDGVRFRYYFNPTPNDRNLEWDMKKNLWCSKPGYLGNPQP